MSEELYSLIRELKAANEELSKAESSLNAAIYKMENYLFYSKLEEQLIASIKEKVPIAEDIGISISRNGLTVTYYVYAMLDIFESPKFTIFFPWDDKIFS